MLVLVQIVVTRHEQATTALSGESSSSYTDSHLYHPEKQIGLYSFFSKIYDQLVVNVLVNL